MYQLEYVQNGTFLCGESAIEPKALILPLLIYRCRRSGKNGGCCTRGESQGMNHIPLPNANRAASGMFYANPRGCNQKSKTLVSVVPKKVSPRGHFKTKQFERVCEM